MREPASLQEDNLHGLAPPGYESPPRRPAGDATGDDRSSPAPGLDDDGDSVADAQRRATLSRLSMATDLSRADSALSTTAMRDSRKKRGGVQFGADVRTGTSNDGAAGATADGVTAGGFGGFPASLVGNSGPSLTSPAGRAQQPNRTVLTRRNSATSGTGGPAAGGGGAASVSGGSAVGGALAGWMSVRGAAPLDLLEPPEDLPPLHQAAWGERARRVGAGCGLAFGGAHGELRVLGCVYV